MTRRLPRLPRGYRLAGFMGPAERSCRSFVATSTTSWSLPRRMETPIRQARPQAGCQRRWIGGTGGSRPNLPRNWQEIGLGDLVVVQEGPEDGWYEAIVVEANDDMLTLRWRDYPRQRPVVRHRLRLGLLYPGAKPTAATGKSTKPAVAAKLDKTVAANPDEAANRRPRLGRHRYRPSRAGQSRQPMASVVRSRSGRESWRSVQATLARQCQRSADHAATV